MHGKYEISTKYLAAAPKQKMPLTVPLCPVYLRAVVWVKGFLLGRSQRVRIDRQLSEEVRVTSGVPQGSVLGPLLLLALC